MQILTANLTGKVTKKTLNGRSYLVAPVTMIVPGVLGGSKGKLLYTANEVAKNYDSWNGVPLTLSHPKVNGQYVSARSPGVLDTYGLGYVYNVSLKEDRLVGEAWFDEILTNTLDATIITNLNAGTEMELSTGLFTTDIPAENPNDAIYAGVKYDAIATNFRPDHLAILLNEKGACSISHGCGVLVNKEHHVVDEDGKVLTANELSHDQLRALLRLALQQKFTQAEPNAWVYDVYDDYFVYEQGYEDNNLWKMKYTKTDTGVELSSEDPVQVVREISFNPVTNTSELEENMAKKELIDSLVANSCGCWTEEDRKVLDSFTEKRLEGLVENSKKVKEAETIAANALKGFKSEDGKTELKFDSKASKFALVVNSDPEEDAEDDDGVEEETTSRTSKKGKKVTTNKVEKEPTVDEWLKNAPRGIQSAVRNAMVIENRERESLVEELTANIGEDKLERVTKFLKSKDLDELRTMVDLLPKRERDEDDSRSLTSFFGSSIASNRSAKDEDDDDNPAFSNPKGIQSIIESTQFYFIIIKNSWL